MPLREVHEHKAYEKEEGQTDVGNKISPHRVELLENFTLFYSTFLIKAFGIPVIDQRSI